VLDDLRTARFRLTNFIDRAALPGLQARVTPPEGFVPQLFANDRLGDCTIVGCANFAMLAAVKASTSVPVITDDDVIARYSKVDGYNPADPSTDRGGIELDVLNDWRHDPFNGAQLLAFAAIDVHDLALLRYAVQMLGAVYVGLELPTSAQAQTGGLWDTAPGMVPGSWGGHCLAPGTRVLSDDLRWLPVESLQPGEAVLGFDEAPSVGGAKRLYRRSIVEATTFLDLPCYDLEFEDGTRVRCSEDHVWLVNSEGNLLWMRTDALAVNSARASRIAKPFPALWDQDMSRDAGYLAAAFDGEGWIDGGLTRAIHKAGFAQEANEELDHVTDALVDRDFPFTR
jgi:hypothetical protein